MGVVYMVLCGFAVVVVGSDDIVVSRRELQAATAGPPSGRRGCRSGACGELNANLSLALAECRGTVAPSVAPLTPGPTASLTTVCEGAGAFAVGDSACLRLGRQRFGGTTNSEVCRVSGPRLFVEFTKCFYNCSCDARVCDSTVAPTATDSSMLSTVRTHPELTTLFGQIKRLGFESTIQSLSEGTLFAPKNSAFEALNLETINLGDLSLILLNHVGVVTILEADMADYFRIGVGTLADDVLTVTPGTPIEIGEAFPGTDKASIVEADILSQSAIGVTHVIDRILRPSVLTSQGLTFAPAAAPPNETPPPARTLLGEIERLAEQTTLSTLLGALQEQALAAASLNQPILMDLLDDSTSTLTLFAPTNVAFLDFENILANPPLTSWFSTFPERLDDLLHYHLVQGEVSLTEPQTLSTLLSETTIDVRLLGSQAEVVFDAGAANVESRNVKASNGVLHIIDAVLVPPSDTEAPTELPPFDIIDVANSTLNLTIFVRALRRAGLTNLLTYDPMRQRNTIMTNAPTLFNQNETRNFTTTSDDDDDLILGGNNTTFSPQDHDNRTNESHAPSFRPTVAEKIVVLELRTAFIPTNEAFLDYLQNRSLADIDTDTLADVLRFHLVDGSLRSTAFPEGETHLASLRQREESSFTLLKTIDNVQLFTSDGQGVRASILDVVASNGIIHVIDAVLLPPQRVTCNDSTAWFKKNTPWKDCLWVSHLPNKRCTVKGYDNTRASYACPAACATSCGDSTTWHKKRDPSKDCAWASLSLKRCDAKGQDNVFAIDACPVACKGSITTRRHLSTLQKKKKKRHWWQTFSPFSTKKRHGDSR